MGGIEIDTEISSSTRVSHSCLSPTSFVDCESRLLNVTKLAASIFNAEIGFIAASKDDSIWFKAAIGLDSSELRQSAASHVCRLFAEQKPIIFLGTDSGKTLQKSESSSSLAFFVAVPICPEKLRDGGVIGAMCIADSKPRTVFSERQLSEFKTFGHICFDLVTQGGESRRRRPALTDIRYATLCHETLNPLHIIQNLVEQVDVIDSEICNLQSLNELVHMKQTIQNEVGKVVKLVKEMGQVKHFDDGEVRGSQGFDSKDSVVINLNKLLMTSALKYEMLLPKSFTIFKRFDLSETCMIKTIPAMLSSLLDRIFMIVSRLCLDFSLPEESEKSIDITARMNKGNTQLTVEFRFPAVACALEAVEIPTPLDELLKSSVLFGKEILSFGKGVLWFALDVVPACASPQNKGLIRKLSGPDQSFQQNHHDLTSVRVLACEDERIGRLILSSILEKCGLKKENISIVSDGNKVLEFLDEQKQKQNLVSLPHLALFDIVMPNMNGDVCLKVLRERGYSFPVIATTACQRSYKYKEVGFDGFIPKPYKRRDIFTVIMDVLNKKRTKVN